MGFKDAVEKDVKKIFLNASEFAEVHEFGGIQVICVVDEDKFKDKQTVSKTLEIEGVYKDLKTVFVDKNDLSFRPKKDQQITLDGKEFEIIECKEDMEMYEILLGNYASTGGY